MTKQRNPIKTIETRFLVGIQEQYMTKIAEENIVKQYKLKRNTCIYDQLTQRIINDIDEMISLQEDPEHWSLTGYKSISDFYKLMKAEGFYK